MISRSEKPPVAPVPERYRPALERVATYFWPHKVEGWIEYYFWDLLHGRRAWPNFLEPSEEIVTALHALKDGTGVWPVWSFARQLWGVVPVRVWAEHAKTMTYIEAQEMCEIFRQEYEQQQQQQQMGAK